MKREIEKFLEQFPTDATSWAQATDEVRDLARLAREHLEEYDGVIVEAVDFRHAKTPAEWNTKGREFILDSFDRMQERARSLLRKVPRLFRTRGRVTQNHFPTIRVVGRYFRYDDTRPTFRCQSYLLRTGNQTRCPTRSAYTDTG